MEDTLTLQEQAQGYLKYASVYKTSEEVRTAISNTAKLISNSYHDKFPLFLNILGHGAFFTTHLLSYLTCDAQLDTIQVSSVESQTGSIFRIVPNINIIDRDVVVLDELLDDGKTMKLIIQSCKDWGAKSVASAVLCNKDNDNKIIQPNYSVFHAPKNVYLFGCGMNVYGFWSHLPDIKLLNSQ